VPSQGDIVAIDDGPEAFRVRVLPTLDLLPFHLPFAFELLEQALGVVLLGGVQPASRDGLLLLLENVEHAAPADVRLGGELARPLVRVLAARLVHADGQSVILEPVDPQRGATSRDPLPVDRRRVFAGIEDELGPADLPPVASESDFSAVDDGP